MPGLGQPTNPAHDPDPRAALAAALLAARVEFVRGFRSSKRNPANLRQLYDGMMVTVYHRKDDGDRYGWFISDDEGNRSSPPRGYDTQEDAMDALWEALGGGW